MAFPAQRLRRLRQHPGLRRMIRETALDPGDLVMPYFIRFGREERRPIASMPGQAQLTIDLLVKELKHARSLGIPAAILFGIPDKKDARGSGAHAKDGVIQQALRAAKDAVPDMVLLADLCFCEYTDHGHCGIIHPRRGAAKSYEVAPGGTVALIEKVHETDYEIDNDATLDLIAKTAVSQAEAGADVIAPSGMTDGMVQAIRSALDKGGFQHIPILSYAVKYASAFYGPFRDAAESPPRFGDRSGYQMDPANAAEALREAALDVQEGADMLMVKPALAYLDVLSKVKERFGLPTSAYSVSGEYAMIKAAAERGWIDERRTVLESLTSIKRAGADFILTYHALDAARWLAG